MEKEKDQLDTLFKNLQTEFDIKTPTIGHENRFLNKLKTNASNDNKSKGLLSSSWKYVITIAATVVICFTAFSYFNNQLGYKELASVSPKMAKVQTFFTNTITKELSKLDSEETPEFQELIVDALFKIKVLEEDYLQLTLALNERQDDELIISAMILNFQDRIRVLEDVMEEIDRIQSLEINTTII